MKKPFFPRIRIPRPFSPRALWLLIHGGLGAALAVSVVLWGPPAINTDLLGILPPSRLPGAAAEADKILGAQNARRVYLLAESADFSEAKNAALLFYESFAGSGIFENLSFYADRGITEQFTRYLYDYRYVLLDPETRAGLEGGGAEEIAGEALAAAFGALNFTGLDVLEGDPFLLTDRELRYLLSSTLVSGGALFPREDILAAESGGNWYVLIRGTLAPRGVSLTNADSAVERIYRRCRAVTDLHRGVRFIYSGVPFHSYESSSKAQREISLISSLSVILIILLFVCLFRSLLPALVSAAAIGVSILSAAAATLLFFREIHVLTFVFGTTLIGICVDYSIHYFIHWRGNRELTTGQAIRSHVFRGITMSFISSAICFIALFFAPFLILKQFALFSAAGLLSSFLSVLCLYPYIKTGKKRTLLKQQAEPGLAAVRKKPRGPGGGVFRGSVLGGIVLASLVLLWVNRDAVRIENNIGALYTMSETLRESEKTAAAILNQGSPGWYFLVSADSPEELLVHEEALTARLGGEIQRGNLRSYLAVSNFTPSRETQRRNYAAAGLLLPLAERQFSYLGFPPETAAAFRRDFAEAAGKYSLPGSLPPYMEELIAGLWIGESGGRYYSCVLPLGPQGEEAFRDIPRELEFVFLIHKVKDINAGLDSLTRAMALLFAAAYVLIAGTVFFIYPPGEAAAILVIPLVLILVTAAVLAAADIPLQFFSAVGLILVFGLGLDYMFYITEGSRSSRGDLTVLGIFLSFITTALSFGALILSSFVPVHLFGLTVFSGLTTAFISTMLFKPRVSRENHHGSGGLKTGSSGSGPPEAGPRSGEPSPGGIPREIART